MERCVALNGGGPIGPDLFPDNLTAQAPGSFAMPSGGPGLPEEGVDLEAYLGAVKGFFMHEALARAEGNKTRAARLLGMSFRAYRYWLQEMGTRTSLPAGFPNPGAFPPPEALEGEPKGEIPNDFL
jgi:two-component system response regulator PilR (NtrC family)